MLKVTTYISEVTREIKKVTWPSKKQTQNMTLLVIGVSLVVGLYIGLLDTIFQKLMASIL
ncbi:preprotein translocase subunit SecE [Candidatus Woesebacteria bacterium]|nr:preprotein translocase subunit SecE [Candidatus Woesebacteria bacterium]